MIRDGFKAMIAKIQGVLRSIEQGKALIETGGGSAPGLTYEVLLPAYAAARLQGSIGQAVTLSTLYYVESQGQGSTLFPRLAGFPTLQEQQFFELFTTCKGIGHRKALRAMALEVGQLAGAIADRDVAVLQSLPEIGRRTAETIIVTLRDKVDRFLSMGPSSPGAAEAGSATPATPPSRIAREAMEVLMQLGENRQQAVDWIDQATRDDDPPRDVQDLVSKVYQLKAVSQR